MLARIKQFFGIGGVSVELQVDETLSQSAGYVLGTVILTSKSPQQVTGIEVKLVGTITRGPVGERRTHTHECGKVTPSEAFEMTPGERKEVGFRLPIENLNTTFYQTLGNAGGMLGAIGQIGSMMDEEDHDFRVHAHVSVKGSIGTGQSQRVQIVSD